jgi:hypothetical protein
MSRHNTSKPAKQGTPEPSALRLRAAIVKRTSGGLDPEFAAALDRVLPLEGGFFEGVAE